MRLHRVSDQIVAAIVGLSCSVLGCATASQSPQPPPVIPVNGVPGAPCVNVGTVIGESQARGWGSSGAPTAEQLASEAMGDAMQRAAQRGATHIFLSPVTVDQKNGAPFSATMTGAAFRCPPGVH